MSTTISSSTSVIGVPSFKDPFGNFTTVLRYQGQFEDRSRIEIDEEGIPNSLPLSLMGLQNNRFPILGEVFHIGHQMPENCIQI